MTRRILLTQALGLSAGLAATHDAIPIIDSHIHLFDPGRPKGVPWPAKDNKILYKPALPARYRSIASPLGVVGAVVVECSPWLEDNQWVLDLAATDRVVVGTVGRLEPGTPDFAAQLERFSANPLFRGIRCGNLWGADLGKDLSNPRFTADLGLLSRAGLALDVANPDADLLAQLVRLTDAVPALRVIIDHLPRMGWPVEARVRAECEANLRRLGSRPQVFAKVSGVLRRVDGRVPLDAAFYRAALDRMWDVFGEDRLVYGSDWPNSDLWAEYPEALRIVRSYLGSKERETAEKLFWKNSSAAYRWVKRDAGQPDPSGSVAERARPHSSTISS